MGNFRSDAAIVQQGHGSKITRFYSTDAWIEGKAELQLCQVEANPAVKAIAAFPDLHPGKFGPVGCAILSEKLVPQWIGPDIGCGMTLFRSSLPVRKLRLDRAAERLRGLGGVWQGDAGEALEEAGLPMDLYCHALGTIGGGNHFCELQKLKSKTPESLLADAENVWLLVHSGSRALGFAVFERLGQLAPAGFEQGSDAAFEYLAAHDQAVRWAALNRQIIARRVADALRCEIEIVTDAPHNLVEATLGGFLHRKGAAKADLPLVPLAGSRNTPSYLMQPTGTVASALHSLAHGAGRKYDRASMFGRVGAKKSDLQSMQRNAAGGPILCEDRQLLIEEAPQAYKNVEKVRNDLVGFGLATVLATFEPLLTYKKTLEDKND